MASTLWVLTLSVVGLPSASSSPAISVMPTMMFNPPAFMSAPSSIYAKALVVATFMATATPTPILPPVLAESGSTALASAIAAESVL
jgi:hypothetical protein